MRNELRSLFRHLHRRRRCLRLRERRWSGEINGDRIHPGLGRLIVRWFLAHARRVPGGSRSAVFRRCLAAPRSLPDSDPGQSMVADPGRRMPASRRAGSRGQAAGPCDDPERLRLPREDLIVADGRAARVRDVDSSKPPEARDYRPRLEAFLEAAAVPNASGAAERLAATYRTLAELLSAEPLVVAEDGGRSAAAVLASARELMVQAAADELLVRTPLATQAAVADFLKILIGFRRDECLVLLLLDVRNGLLDYQIIAVGRPNSVEVDQRRIVMRAIACGATGIIIAHNHPSGDPWPSASDLRVTRELADTCRALGIYLRDHLVIAGGQVRSAMFVD